MAHGKDGSTKCLFSLCFTLKEERILDEYGGMFSIKYKSFNKLK